LGWLEKKQKGAVKVISECTIDLKKGLLSLKVIPSRCVRDGRSEGPPEKFIKEKKKRVVEEKSAKSRTPEPSAIKGQGNCERQTVALHGELTARDDGKDRSKKFCAKGGNRPDEPYLGPREARRAQKGERETGV